MKPVLAVVVLVGVAAGGFFLGRKTALRTASGLPGPAAPATASANGAAPSPAAPQAGVPLGHPVSTATAPAAPSGPRRLVLTLRGPLEQSIAGALKGDEREVAEELTQVVNRLLVWHLQVARDGRKGDRLEVLYTPPGARGADVAPGADGTLSPNEPVVDAIRYTSQKLGKTFAAYRYKANGAPFARYYQPDGSELEQRLVDGPIREYEQVTSLIRDGRHHKGVDFKTPVGSPVLAPFDGVVVRRNWHFSANGNCLEIDDPQSGRHAIFLHLEVAPKEMQPGRKVKKGEQIALSGNTGHSTAPHLHYQLESPSGRILDPFGIHATRRLTLDGPALAAFETEKKRLEGLLGASM